MTDPDMHEQPATDEARAGDGPQLPRVGESGSNVGADSAKWERLTVGRDEVAIRDDEGRWWRIDGTPGRDEGSPGRAVYQAICASVDAACAPLLAEIAGYERNIEEQNIKVVRAARQSARDLIAACDEVDRLRAMLNDTGRS